MQHDYVLKQLNFDLLTPPPGSEGEWGLGAKYLLPYWCICDSLKFEMQNGHVMKKLNFDFKTLGRFRINYR